MKAPWHGSIRRRLSLAFGAMAMAAVVQGALGWWGAAQLADQVHETVAVNLPKSISLGDVAARTAAFRIEQFQYTLASDADRPALERTMESGLASLDSTLRALGDAAVDYEDKASYAEVSVLWRRYVEHDRRIRVLMQDGLPLQATQLLDGDARKVFEQCQTVLQSLVQANARSAKSLAVEATRLRELAVGGVAAAIVLSLAAGLGMAGPAVLRLRSQLTRAQEVAEALARGDLRNQPTPSGDDELAALLAAMRRMTERWRALVSQVREGAHHVSSASSEIAQASTSLSQRTEEQAAGVQSVGALSAALASTAAASSGNAHRADVLAQQSTQDVRLNGIQLGELSDALQAVTASAQRISEISTSIDAIANQTNILALNAGIEAARAGSHGRGFAVVAHEVRALAHQAGKAAHGIRHIVGESLERAQVGAAAAQSAVARLNTLAQAIERSAGWVQDIALSSQSQKDSVGQMNQRIAEIEVGTHHNAALVEELAASAHSMHVQAQRLVEWMDVFELGSSAGAGPAVDAVLQPERLRSDSARAAIGGGARRRIARIPRSG